MAVPVFVGAGSGVAILTGTGTVSKTGCTAGNLLIMQFVVRGEAEDYSGASSVNIETLAGVDSDVDHLIGPSGTTDLFCHLFAGRVIANGTCSRDFTVGASGNDLYARLYEFSGTATGTTVDAVFENGADPDAMDALAATSTSVGDPPVVTNGNDRLALVFVHLASNQAIGDFTGESGGDWTEAVAEYADATGATATLQLQTASMPSATTIDGGSITVSSVAWDTISTALIPVPEATAPTIRVVSSGLRW